MVLFVGILHVAICVVMSVLVLLHSGQGGGLSDFMGGGSMASGSTVMEKNLDRVTVVVGAALHDHDHPARPSDDDHLDPVPGADRERSVDRWTDWQAAWCSSGSGAA